MKQIHGNLTPDKVDETMYALLLSYFIPSSELVTWADGGKRALGISYGNRMRSARRLSTPSRATRLESPSTTTNWRRSWKGCNKSSWMSRCSRRDLYRCQIRSSACLLSRLEIVSRAMRIARMSLCTNDVSQSKARHQLRPRTTKRKSCASCRRRWPCKPPRGGDQITSTFTEHNNDLVAWYGLVVKWQKEEDGSEEQGSGNPSMEADFVSSVLRLRFFD